MSIGFKIFFHANMIFFSERDTISSGRKQPRTAGGCLVIGRAAGDFDHSPGGRVSVESSAKIKKVWFIPVG